MKLTHQFGQISKVEDQPDGTIMVYGIASSGSVDSAGETVTPEAMKAALPDYSKFPALREMHNPSAAGRVTEAEVDADGFTNIAAHVVDPLAITKVKTGVYAGFSIGGKVLKRDPSDRSVITALRLVEISLVDSPCQQDAVLTMWKADMTQYTPSGEEVVAKARELAEAAGSNRYKDFLYKARETLIADALATDLGDEGDEPGDDEAAKADGADDAAVAFGDGAEAAPAAEDAPQAAQEPQEGETGKEAANTPDAAPDPAQALQEAIGKAQDVVAQAAVPTEEAAPFADLAKVGAALRLISFEDPIAKGLWQVETLASIMDRFQSLAASVAYEAEAEKDGSEAPAKAADVLAQIGELLIMMAKEEVAEAVAGLPGMDAPMVVIVDSDDDTEIVMLANKLVDTVKADTDLMAKAGARNSKADAAMIQQSHDHMAKLGAVCDKANCVDKDDSVEAANKALTAENERLAKALSDGSAAIEEITKSFGDTIADLKKRLEEVESRAAPPKTAAGALRAVTKTQDASPNAGADAPTITADELQKVVDSLPEAERGQLLLRIALANPQIVKSARAAA